MKIRILKICKPLMVMCLTLIITSIIWAQQSPPQQQPWQQKFDDIQRSLPKPKDPQVVKFTAEQFLEDHEIKLEETTDLHKRYFLLRYLVPAALAAGENEKAQNYAQELLNAGERLKSQPGFGPGNLGAAIHISNIILGQISLNNGDIEKAKEYLLAAGKINGDPSLQSFGPDMLLARELLEKGERDTVIQYLDLCANFWKSENGKLEQWKNDIKQGKMPKFLMNLGGVFDSWNFAQ